MNELSDQQFWQAVIAFVVLGSAIWSICRGRKDRLGKAIRRGKL